MRKGLSLSLLVLIAACASRLPKEAIELYDIGKPDGWMEIEADRDGRIIEIEADIELSQVPKVVMDAAKAALPGGTVTGAEKEIIGKKHAYEVKMTKGSVGYEFVFTPDGTLIESEKEIGRADAPDGVVDAGLAAVPGSEFRSVEVVERYGVSTYHVKSTKNGGRYKMVVTPDGKVIRAVREAKAEIEIPLK
ncbi:MAG: PepSY-like domain-containing protein [Planctomycetota bacterium]